MHVCRYRDRFWRESTFDGLDLVRSTLDEAYGKDKVSLTSATFRWMNHHSKMIENGMLIIELKPKLTVFALQMG